ncbi:MAG: SDR family oxidoreductase [Leptolyngbyaceae cyanobacterium SM1_1_3]|nr:SDR family oxidoreductase [Leptolyngbyaceae cyanobacterium SM1_1_3]NJN03421.1 SDR family oxidoreductase [Leptolyngbyaceae cyanobacterium RM1_1_2]NJO08817.1 SDR family oxidoreductase [Leptolyngbyaceae cyanobacterium SL_1_1]
MAAASKTAIITGGAQGIGKGIALNLLTQGWNVAIADIDSEAGADCIKEFELFSDAVIFCQTDVTDEISVQSFVDQSVERFGSIHGLVNNAGIADPYNDPVEKLSLNDWNHKLATNLTGYFLVTKHAVPYLRKTRGAAVNIASTRVLQSEPNTEAYVASKGGIVALTHALAISLGPHVRVNCVSPGWITVSDWQKESQRSEPNLSDRDHDQHPAGRVGTPNDVAGLVAYLLAEEAGFITGQNFIVDGGMTRKMIYAE